MKPERPYRQGLLLEHSEDHPIEPMSTQHRALVKIAFSLVALSFQLSGQQVPTGVGSAVLPNGRTITPAEEWIRTAPYPFSLALRPDGQQLAVPSVGFPFALNFISLHSFSTHAEQPEVLQLPPGPRSDPAVNVFVGVAYSADGKLLYVSTGDPGTVEVREVGSWRKVAAIALNDETYKESFAAALALSPDGQRLYVIDQANWRVVILDTATRRIEGSVPTGVNPSALALSPDGRRLYIANSGLFEYRTIAGVEKADTLHTGLRFAPFGYPSKQAETGTIAEGKAVPALGQANSAQGSSLWSYDLTDGEHPSLAAKLRLGAAIRPGSSVGGAAPSAVAASLQHVYVALSHGDAVAVISPDGRAVETETPLSPFTSPAYFDSQHRPLRGIMPSGLALGPHRLYVTEAGINALATVDLDTNRVLGHLPVGWNPSAVALSRDGQMLYVVNTKGRGSGPNAGAGATPGPTYVGQLQYGSVSAIPAATSPDTAAVLRDNKAALTAGSPLPRLQHVFLIIRENRTFDEVLGDLPGANGDTTLARFGLRAAVPELSPAASSGGSEGQASVTPNAHAIAQQFATSDAFYTDSDVSADGHRWVVGIQPTPWMNVAWTSNYGGRRHADPFSTAPGRRALGGSDDAPMPEDEPEYGSLWEHITDAHLPLLNYGEGLELEGSDEAEGTEPEGQRLVLNAPLPTPVFEATDRRYPTFNLGIPDQYRESEFERDFSRRVLHTAAGTPLPRLIVIRLPNDHTAKPRPQDGYPAKASYVADNDLALGKLLDFLSHSAVWKSSAVFVTEDDAQDGVDHVDAHRSVLLVASPYAKVGYISHRHSDMGSIEKTIYELLGLCPLNLEDALASDLSDMFTMKPRAGALHSACVGSPHL